MTRTLWIFLACAACLCGCRSAPPPTTDGTPSFALKLHTTTQDGRITRFKLDEQGNLEFAGGVAALGGRTAPSCTLTAQQRQAIWNIIVEGQLLHAKGSRLIRGQQATFDFSLSHPGGHTNVRAIDDQLPAMHKLHDALLQMHAHARYSLPDAPPPPPAEFRTHPMLNRG